MLESLRVSGHISPRTTGTSRMLFAYLVGSVLAVTGCSKPDIAQTIPTSVENVVPKPPLLADVPIGANMLGTAFRLEEGGPVLCIMVEKGKFQVRIGEDRYTVKALELDMGESSQSIELTPEMVSMVQALSSVERTELGCRYTIGIGIVSKTDTVTPAALCKALTHLKRAPVDNNGAITVKARTPDGKPGNAAVLVPVREEPVRVATAK